MQKAYGIDFEEGMSQANIDLWCYANQNLVKKLNGELLGETYHLSKACHELFVKTGALIWHRWFEDHVDAWCTNKFHTVWGSASCGKSNDYGAIVVADWWAAPLETCTFTCSTTVEYLEKRIWESVKRHFHSLPKGSVPGKYSKSNRAIINEGDDENAEDLKAGIWGIAVAMGTEEEAVSKLIGVHLPRVRLLIDEMQGTRRAAVKSRKNLSKGARDFRFTGIGNPMSHFDPLCEHSEPKGDLDGRKFNGWDDITVEDDKWPTRFGMCYHYDGFKSPAIVDAKGNPVTEEETERLHFLINQGQIDDDIAENDGEEDHPDIWTMDRGFPPPEGVKDTVLSPRFIAKHKMKEKAQWQFQYIMAAGLDPAFTSGGDKCILQLSRIGHLNSGELAIEFLDPINILIKATSEDTRTEQVVKQVVKICRDYSIPPKFIGVDETGTQRIGDALAKELKNNDILRVDFAGAPSDRRMDVDSHKTAKEELKDRVTELWYMMQKFGAKGQIRGLNDKAAKEFCERDVLPGIKKKLISKTEYKKMYKHSPDHGDACAVNLDVVRVRLGVLPGSNNMAPQQVMGGFNKREAQAFDFDSDEENYMNDQFSGSQPDV